MRRYVFFSITILIFLGGKFSKDVGPTKFVSYVNPFIGRDGKGKTYPRATVPHGTVQLSPDNSRNGWYWISG